MNLGVEILKKIKDEDEEDLGLKTLIFKIFELLFINYEMIQIMNLKMKIKMMI